MRAQKNSRDLPVLLNCLFDKPMTVRELAEKTGIRHQDVAWFLSKARKDGLVHVMKYEKSKSYSHQPVMVFQFGPGIDAKKASTEEMERRDRERAVVVIRRDPFIAQFFGSAA